MDAYEAKHDILYKYCSFFRIVCLLLLVVVVDFWSVVFTWIHCDSAYRWFIDHRIRKNEQTIDVIKWRKKNEYWTEHNTNICTIRKNKITISSIVCRAILWRNYGTNMVIFQSNVHTLSLYEFISMFWADRGYGQLLFFCVQFSDVDDHRNIDEQKICTTTQNWSIHQTLTQSTEIENEEYRK